MFNKKIQFRLLEDTGEKWVHFCYVSEELKEEFDEKVGRLQRTANYWAIKWAMEDFGISQVDTQEQLLDLKERIKNMYKDKYPELYIDSSTDSQGWLRVWYTNHMMKELEYIG